MKYSYSGNQPVLSEEDKTAEKFSLFIEEKGEKLSVSGDYLKNILNHDGFYDSVVEMQNYQETD